VFLTSTHIAIVMEYASGGELFEFVKRSGRLSEDAARFFFQQLISGVDYCHRQVSDPGTPLFYNLKLAATRFCFQQLIPVVDY